VGFRDEVEKGWVYTGPGEDLDDGVPVPHREFGGVAAVLVREGVVGEEKEGGSGSSLVAGDVKMASHSVCVK